MKKFLYMSLILCLSLFFNFGVAEASDLELVQKEYVPVGQAQESAVEYLQIVSENSYEGWKNATLKEPVELFDFDGNLTSYLFDVSNEHGTDQGYIIVSAFSDFPGVIESTREGSSPYKNVENGSGIYVGPLLSYAKSKDAVVDLQSEKTTSKDELENTGYFNLKNIKALSKETSLEFDEQIITPFAASDYSYKLISGVPDYTWYRGCAPTSAANIIRYWRAQGYTNLVQSTTTTKHLIDVLADRYMFTNSSGGTTVSNMKSGIRNYMNDRGYYPTIGDSATFAYHKGEINASRPSWITTANHPVWGDHAVTGVGFEEYYDTVARTWKRQIIVHDTWSSTPRDYWISWSSYFDHVISIRL